MKWPAGLLGVAVLAGCSEPGRAYELSPGYEQVAQLEGAGQTAELGVVQVGTLQVIVECTGEGQGTFTYQGRQLTAPCASGGEVSETDINVTTKQKDATITLEGGDGVEAMRAVIGWSSALVTAPPSDLPSSP